MMSDKHKFNIVQLCCPKKIRCVNAHVFLFCYCRQIKSVWITRRLTVRPWVQRSIYVMTLRELELCARSTVVCVRLVSAVDNQTACKQIMSY